VTNSLVEKFVAADIDVVAEYSGVNAVAGIDVEYMAIVVHIGEIAKQDAANCLHAMMAE
jgi:hypothetical protein